MNYTDFINELLIYNPKFSEVPENSVLGSLIRLILDQINSINDNSTENKTNIYDILSPNYAKEDYLILGSLLGIQKNVQSLTDIIINQNIIIPSLVNIQTIDLSKSILDVFLSIYETSNNFPNKLIITQKDSLTLIEVYIDNSYITNNLQHITVPGKIINILTEGINVNTPVIFSDMVLNDYLTCSIAKNVNFLVSVESDENYLTRIITNLQQKRGATLERLISEVKSILTNNLAHVVGKNFARGLLTADIVIFPSVGIIYDNNFNVISSRTQLSSLVKNVIDDLLPLGVDIQCYEAIPVRIDVSINLGISTTLNDYSMYIDYLKTEIKGRLLLLFTSINTYSDGYTIDVTTVNNVIMSSLRAASNNELLFFALPSDISIYKNNLLVENYIELNFNEYAVIYNVTLNY